MGHFSYEVLYRYYLVNNLIINVYVKFPNYGPEHRLVASTTWNDRGGSGGQVKQWLTDLGTILALRIEKYNDFKASQTGSSATTRL